MTQEALNAKTAREAKYGELQICGRCNGTGYTNFRPQFGMCFKCSGHGVHIKSNPNAPDINVNYLVKDSAGNIRRVNTKDKGCENISNDLWVNDTFKYVPYKATSSIDVVIVAKYMAIRYRNGRFEEKYSKDFKAMEKLAY
jgi:hypothetical protein